MRWIPPPLEPEGVTNAMTVLLNQVEGAPMKTKISMRAIDLAKGSLQVCVVGQDGAVLSNRAMSRTRLAALLAEQPTCVVAMEACATSHHLGAAGAGLRARGPSGSSCLREAVCKAAEE